MSGGYCTSIDAENDLILNSHILAKLRKEFKDKMNFKTDSNFKESTPGEIIKHLEQIARLIGSLNNYSNLYHEVAWTMATGAEIPGDIINGYYGLENMPQKEYSSLQKRDCYPEK